MIPLGMVVVLFLAYVWPPYLTLDPDRARIVNLQREAFPPHYALLVAHIAFGTVAMVGVCLQIWPWLRKRRPRAHRVIGRVTVYAGVVPAGLTALVIAPFSPGAPGDVVAALLWLTTTVHGVRMIRRRRFAEHRRFMVYCFALTLQIIWGRVWLLALPHLPFWTPEVFRTTLETQAWLGFVINLVIAQLYLDRTASRRRQAPRPKVAAPVP